MYLSLCLYLGLFLCLYVCVCLCALGNFDKESFDNVSRMLCTHRVYVCVCALLCVVWLCSRVRSVCLTWVFVCGSVCVGVLQWCTQVCVCACACCSFGLRLHGSASSWLSDRSPGHGCGFGLRLIQCTSHGCCLSLRRRLPGGNYCPRLHC